MRDLGYTHTGTDFSQHRNLQKRETRSVAFIIIACTSLACRVPGSHESVLSFHWLIYENTLRSHRARSSLLLQLVSLPSSSGTGVEPSLCLSPIVETLYNRLPCEACFIMLQQQQYCCCKQVHYSSTAVALLRATGSLLQSPSLPLLLLYDTYVSIIGS